MMDFSRQLKVQGMNAETQARLAAAKVLIFGAGGLGATAIPYLAAAGVGALTIVDDDAVALSNLHRQILFTRGDIGRNKAVAAAAFCEARAEGSFQAIERRLSTAEIVAAMQAADIVLDCSDSRQLAYQLSDAALFTGRPVVFANAAAMGGQLFTMQPHADLPCWRCLWSEEVLPSGNCDALGVLGPVPATLGLWQALEAIKLITRFAPSLSGELLQYDFVSMRQMRLRVAKAADCNHHKQASDMVEEAVFEGDFAAAKMQGLRIIDIRSAEEIAQKPLLQADNCILMSALLDNPLQYIGRQEAVLLVCAAGQRSRSAAKLLRKQGFAGVSAYPKAW